MRRPSDIWVRSIAGIWIAGISIAVSSIAPATAYDAGAASAAFAADRAKCTACSLVLGGWSGNDSKVDRYSIERIMDRAAWSSLWARHAPDTRAPDVDFSSAMVIAIFAGAVHTSVTPEIHLDRVTESEKIAVTTMSYVYDVLLEERKNLYIFVLLPRSTKAVQVFARSYGLEKSPQDQTILLQEFSAIPQPGAGK